MKEIKTVSIVGMGALGLLYADIIQTTLGPGVVQFVMDNNRYEKYRNQAFTINGNIKDFKLVSIEQVTQVPDLVIVAVKSTGLESCLPIVQKITGENTIVISVLNGISSEEVLAEKIGMEKIIHCVAQGMDAMKFGNALNYTKKGELHIGLAKNEKQENLDAIKTFFDKANNPYIVEDDIVRRMWCKFMLNVGVNQTCMAYSATYSMVLNQPELLAIYTGAMREVIAIAEAEKINITEDDLNFYVDITRTLDPNGTPSMGQDRIQKRKSEVDSFAGTVIEIAAKHGIPVPVNQALYERVKEIEKEY